MIVYADRSFCGVLMTIRCMWKRYSAVVQRRLLEIRFFLKLVIESWQMGEIIEKIGLFLCV